MVDEWRDDEPIDELIARVREERGLTQYALADDVARVSRDTRITREYISRWENRKRIPEPYWRGHLGTVLGIPREVLDRATVVARARRVGSQQTAATSVAPAMATAPQHDSSVTLKQILDLWDELMRRRIFLGGAGAAAATTFVGGLSTSLAPTVPDVEEALTVCAALTADYRRLDSVLGPGAVYAQATEHHRRLLAWLRRAREHTEWLNVADLVADVNILVAWLHFDLEQYDEAASLYRQTFDIATEVDDVSLRAFLIGRMSRTLSELGRHVQALAFAEAAQRVAGTVAIPPVRSWLAVTRAYVHGCLGDEKSCRDDLELATALLDRETESPPPYIAFYGRPYLLKWSGHALLRLAEHKASSLTKGRVVIDQALAIWSGADVRESGEVLTACASARLAGREINEAAELTGRAYAIAIGTGSPRILRYITDLRQRMHPYRQTRAVRSLEELLLMGR